LKNITVSPFVGAIILAAIFGLLSLGTIITGVAHLANGETVVPE
jgi:hypothetical protein